MPEVEHAVAALVDRVRRAGLLSLAQVAHAPRDSELYGPPPLNLRATVLGAWNTPHGVRNLIAAMCITHDRCNGDTSALWPVVPCFGRRTWLRRPRPCVLDERLLGRLVVMGSPRHHHQRETAVPCFILADAGCTPAEVSAVTPRDVDVSATGALAVWAAGDRDRKRRLLPLDSWASSMIGPYLDAVAVHQEQPIAYTGHRAPGGPSGTASCQRVLNRVLKTAGIVGQDITATSVSLTAAERAAARGDVQEAVRLLGRNTAEAAARDLRHVGTKPSPVQGLAYTFMVDDVASSAIPPAEAPLGRSTDIPLSR